MEFEHLSAENQRIGSSGMNFLLNMALLARFQLEIRGCIVIPNKWWDIYQQLAI
jgi:hypothetical protein